MEKVITTPEQLKQLKELVFAPEPMMGIDIAKQVGISPLVVSYYKSKWGVARKYKKYSKKGVSKTPKPKEIADEAEVLYGLQKTYQRLSVVSKAVFLSDLEKFVQSEKAIINKLSL